MRFPLSETSMKWAPIYIPLVFGLVWLYNSYKLGRLNQLRMKKWDLQIMESRQKPHIPVQTVGQQSN